MLTGTTAGALAAAPIIVKASSGLDLPSSLVIADMRFAASRAFARKAARLGARVVQTEGDITDFWRDELDLLCRREKPSLSGLTAHPALFYLEHLAMDRGSRVIFRQEVLRTEPVVPPLAMWRIAPRPGSGSPAIQDKGLNPWTDCPDPGWGSVVGNALDYGGGPKAA